MCLPIRIIWNWNKLYLKCIKVYNFWTKIKLPTSGHLLIHPTIYGRSISSGVVARLIFSNFWFYSPSKSTSLVTINDCVYMGLNSHQWREGIHQKGFINGCGGLFGIFITPVNVISFPPLIYTTANLTENLKIILLFFFRENARRKFKMKKTRLSKMTIVSSSRNQKGAKEISIIIRLVKFQKGSRKT